MIMPRPDNVRRRNIRGRLLAALTVVGLAAGFESSSYAGAPLGLFSAGALGQVAGGTIKGRLVWGGDQAPEAKDLIAKGKSEKDPGVCAKDAAIPDESLVVDPKTKGIKNAIVYLVKPTKDNPEAVKALVAKAPQVEIDQQNCRFIPRSTVLHADQVVVFKATDQTNHNVHLSGFATANSSNQLLPPGGQMQKKLEADRRPIPLTCDIHPWMKGSIMVFEHPYFAVTGEDGSFQIDGVPPGTQNLVIWQELVGYVNEGLAKGMPVNVAGAADVGVIKLDPAKVKK